MKIELNIVEFEDLVQRGKYAEALALVQSTIAEELGAMENLFDFEGRENNEAE